MKRRTKFVRLFCLISLGVVAGGAVFGNIDGVRALDYQSNVGVGFTFEPTLNVTLSNANLMINNLTPGASAEDSNIITVGVSTNVAYGYNLSATVGDATNVTTNLVNGNNNFAALSSGVSSLSGFGNNTWGYSYCIADCDTLTNWVSGSQGSTSMGYAGLPLYTDAGVQLTGANDNTSSSTQFKIAAKASTAQASGEYTNVVNFTAVSNVVPMSLLDAFMASGAEQMNGHYKMQDMTSSICDAVDDSLVPSEMQLIDARDKKVYYVAKLADGHCWMTQNLDLDLTSGVALTSELTDLNDNSLNGAYSVGYSYDADSKVISWKPTNTTRDYQHSTGAGWSNNYNVAYSLDPGEWYWDGDDSTPSCDYLNASAGCTHFTQDRTNANRHLSVGNYYNWSAAIASDDSSSLTNSTYGSTSDPDAINRNPQNSICPKGWRLPTISYQDNIMNSTSEFARVNGLYNDGIANNDKKLIATPLWFVRSGFVSNGILYDPGSGAYYWSSAVYSSYSAYFLYFTATFVNPVNYNFSRDYGWSVRCVAR